MTEKQSSANIFKEFQKKKWYDDDLFNGTTQFKDSVNNVLFKNPLTKRDNIESSDEGSLGTSDYAEDQEDRLSDNSFIDDVIIDKDMVQKRKAQENAAKNIDKNEKIGDEESDEEKYKIQGVAKSAMQKRRDNLKKTKGKRAEETLEKVQKSDGFEIVRQEDYDMDKLSNTLALAKNMLNKRKREAIIDSTFSRYAQDDHD